MNRTKSNRIESNRAELDWNESRHFEAYRASPITTTQKNPRLNYCALSGAALHSYLAGAMRDEPSHVRQS